MANWYVVIKLQVLFYCLMMIVQKSYGLKANLSWSRTWAKFCQFIRDSTPPWSDKNKFN